LGAGAVSASLDALIEIDGNRRHPQSGGLVLIQIKNSASAASAAQFQPFDHGARRTRASMRVYLMP